MHYPIVFVLIFEIKVSNFYWPITWEVWPKRSGIKLISKSSPPKQIPIQSLLYKTTVCLTQPATTFFCLPNEKKTCLKQLLQNFTQQRNRKQSYGNNAQKINVSLIIFTQLLLHNAKFLKTGCVHLTFVFTIT